MIASALMSQPTTSTTTICGNCQEGLVSSNVNNDSLFHVEANENESSTGTTHNLSFEKNNQSYTMWLASTQSENDDNISNIPSSYLVVQPSLLHEDLQNDEDDLESSFSSTDTSCSEVHDEENDNDRRIIMSLDDMVVADEYGQIASSRRELPNQLAEEIALAHDLDLYSDDNESLSSTDSNCDDDDDDQENDDALSVDSATFVAATAEFDETVDVDEALQLQSALLASAADIVRQQRAHYHNNNNSKTNNVILLNKKQDLPKKLSVHIETLDNERDDLIQHDETEIMKEQIDCNLQSTSTKEHKHDNNNQDILLLDKLEDMGLFDCYNEKASTLSLPLTATTADISDSSSHAHSLGGDENNNNNDETTPMMVANKSATTIETAEDLMRVAWADVQISDDEDDDDDANISNDDKEYSNNKRFSETSHFSMEEEPITPRIVNHVKAPGGSTAVDGDTAGSNIYFTNQWSAWYDPPRGRGARHGIAKDTYEQTLFLMGDILSTDDFWTVHNLIDWDNMPVNSMVSFSRRGVKPFWEDPNHCNGGRWIIRSFPQKQSASLFTKVVLSLFLNHLPETDNFTCVTLQVKEKRRGNSIQLWTSSLSQFYAEEMMEHMNCLADGDEDHHHNNERRRGRRKGRNHNKNHRPSNLTFEFCPNCEAIERNAVKLDHSASPHNNNTELKPKRSIRQNTTPLASRCQTVTEIYAEGHKKKHNKKQQRTKGNKADWTNTLIAAMNEGKILASNFQDDDDSNDFTHLQFTCEAPALRNNTTHITNDNEKLNKPPSSPIMVHDNTIPISNNNNDESIDGIAAVSPLTRSASPKITQKKDEIEITPVIITQEEIIATPVASNKDIEILTPKCLTEKKSLIPDVSESTNVFTKHTDNINDNSMEHEMKTKTNNNTRTKLQQNHNNTTYDHKNEVSKNFNKNNKPSKAQQQSAKTGDPCDTLSNWRVRPSAIISDKSPSSVNNTSKPIAKKNTGVLHNNNYENYPSRALPHPRANINNNKGINSNNGIVSTTISNTPSRFVSPTDIEDVKNDTDLVFVEYNSNLLSKTNNNDEVTSRWTGINTKNSVTSMNTLSSTFYSDSEPFIPEKDEDENTASIPRGYYDHRGCWYPLSPQWSSAVHTPSMKELRSYQSAASMATTATLNGGSSMSSLGFIGENNNDNITDDASPTLSCYSPSINNNNNNNNCSNVIVRSQPPTTTVNEFTSYGESTETPWMMESAVISPTVGFGLSYEMVGEQGQLPESLNKYAGINLTENNGNSYCYYYNDPYSFEPYYCYNTSQYYYNQGEVYIGQGGEESSYYPIQPLHVNNSNTTTTLVESNTAYLEHSSEISRLADSVVAGEQVDGC